MHRNILKKSTYTSDIKLIIFTVKENIHILILNAFADSQQTLTSLNQNIGKYILLVIFANCLNKIYIP